MTIRAYVATSLLNREAARQLAGVLARSNIQVTYPWWEQDEAEAMSASVRSAIAQGEVNGVCTADVLVVLLPGRRGTHVEIGCALAQDVPVLLVGEGEGPCVFYDHPGVCRVAREDLLLEIAAHTRGRSMYEITE